jgi:5-methylcytosine-specific restriction protein A
MPLRPCLDCGALSRKTRCPTHDRGNNRATAAHQRAKRAKRPYTYAEQQRRKAVVDAWVELYGYVCPGWRVPPHPSRDLTADHIDAVAVTRDESGPLSVLCRSCNGRKAAHTA